MNSTPLMRPLLQVSELSFSWPRRHVFTAWSAQAPAGLTWLRGANGSGKSTLLKVLGGALPALAGQVRLNTADGCVLEPSIDALAYKREVFWCGPGAIAFDHLKPTEYFGFLQGLYPRFDARAVAGHAEALGLAPHRHSPLAALSTGTQRKVWLAAALSAGTRLRLLDEPLNALDATSLAYLHGVLEAATRDTHAAWLVASHEPPVTRPTHEWGLASH
jgi:ABC-type multidrug transport system ATPase subunit